MFLCYMMVIVIIKQDGGACIKFNVNDGIYNCKNEYFLFGITKLVTEFGLYRLPAPWLLTCAYLCVILLCNLKVDFIILLMVSCNIF